MGEHEDPRRAAPPPRGEERVEVLADRAVGVPDVVGGPEPRERPQRRGQAGQVVEVDEPQIEPVGEGVVEALEAPVADLGLVEPAHHVTPRAAAARTPEAQPSSWKPQPWYAPAKASRSSFSPGSRCWAATDSGV